MTWKSALGLALAPFVSSLVIAIAFAPVQQERQGLLSATPDYSLLNAQPNLQSRGRHKIKVASRRHEQQIPAPFTNSPDTFKSLPTAIGVA
jgi:late competence protein required for DNA uptake (superfamily II DNA/RNA helicase)